MPAPRPGTRAHAREIAARLERSQGHIPWRRRNDPVSELVTTLLSHSTTDVNQLRAFEALRSCYPTWDEVRAAPTAEVEETVRVAGLAGQKGPRIQHALDAIADDPRGDDLERTGNGSLVRRSLGITSFGVNLVDIPPGEGIPEHNETDRDQEELFVVLSGSALLVIDGERIPAPAGTMARLDPEPRRTVVNEGDEVASVLIVSAPRSSGYEPLGWA